MAAVDELSAAEAIEKIQIDFEPLPFVIDPLDTLRPGGPNPRTDGNVWTRPAGQNPGPPVVTELKWTKADFEELDKGRLPMGKAPDEWSYFPAPQRRLGHGPIWRHDRPHPNRGERRCR